MSTVWQRLTDREVMAGEPSRIVVALDGSPAAVTALPVARGLAGQLGATLEALHVTPEAMAVAAVRRRLQLEQDSVALHLEVGDAVEGLLHTIEQPEVALVVLTTHGRSLDPGRGLATVAEAVAARTTRPILLVRPEATAPSGPTGVRRLLIPVDGTPVTMAGLRAATTMAARLGAVIDLLSVVDPRQPGPLERGWLTPPFYVDQPQREWPQWRSEVVTHFRGGPAACPAAVPVRVSVAVGDIGEEIARFAGEHRTDALVLVRGSHLEPGRGRIVRAVLDHTPCPVLLVASPASTDGGAVPQASRAHGAVDRELVRTGAEERRSARSLVARPPGQ
jgi:nucleotide-binding universal stress UspA family protein